MSDYPLGSIMSQSLYIDKRNITYTDKFWAKHDESTRLSRIKYMKIKCKQQGIVDGSVITDALKIWAFCKKNYSEEHVSMNMALYIVCRYKGIPFNVDNADEIIKKKRFIFKAHKVATDLGISFPKINADKVLLDMCDRFGNRGLYFKMKEIYPKARLLHAGNPKATMGAIIYLLLKPFDYKLTHYMIGQELGLSEYTIRIVCGVIREVIP